MNILFGTALAAVAGAASVALGLAGSLAWDLPSGPAIVAASVVLFALGAAIQGAILSGDMPRSSMVFKNKSKLVSSVQ